MATPASYDRAPSPQLLRLLRPQGLLGPLLSLGHVNAGGVGLDVHFRRNDEVHVYCGMTRLVKARALRGGGVKLTADCTYISQACAQGLFRIWRTGETGLGSALTSYVRGVEINPRFTKSEGAIQMQWSRVRKPWVPIDREVVLAHQAEAAALPEVRSALRDLKSVARGNRWVAPSSGATKLDQLAVDSRGRLVLIELKDATKSSDKLDYAPFQLLHYVWIWHGASDAVRDGVEALIRARVETGLTPPIRCLSGGLRAVVGFGQDLRSPEVKRRHNTVLRIVNKHLPRGVGAVELWEHAGGAGKARKLEASS